MLATHSHVHILSSPHSAHVCAPSLLRHPCDTQFLDSGLQEEGVGEAHIGTEMTVVSISILLMLMNLSYVH